LYSLMFKFFDCKREEQKPIFYKIGTSKTEQLICNMPYIKAIQKNLLRTLRVLSCFSYIRIFLCVVT
jgi:hypothetical protein